MTRTCPQCEGEFTPKAKHHVYDVQECRYQGWIQKEVEAAEASVQRVEVHDLDEVRARAEESKEKARYTLIAREHITHTLVATGYFSAEDFDALGIPGEHVNVCTSWIGNFSKRKLMEPISWRVSSKPSRKGGKVWTYKITEKGRDELPALLEDTRREIAGVEGEGSHSSDVPSCGLGHSLDSGDAGPLSPASPDNLPGGRGQARTRKTEPAETASGEILSLLPEPDPESWAA